MTAEIFATAVETPIQIGTAVPTRQDAAAPWTSRHGYPFTSRAQPCRAYPSFDEIEAGLDP